MLFQTCESSFLLLDIKAKKNSFCSSLASQYLFHIEEVIVWTTDDDRMISLGWADGVIAEPAVHASECLSKWRLGRYSLPPAGIVCFHCGPAGLQRVSPPPPFSRRAPAPAPPASRSHSSVHYQHRSRERSSQTSAWLISEKHCYLCSVCFQTGRTKTCLAFLFLAFYFTNDCLLEQLLGEKKVC